jgi:Fe-S-cluster containining protein
MNFPPYDPDGDDTVEWDCLPQELRDEIAAAEENGHSGDCLFFDRQTRRCRHYEFRPLTCQRFEPGNPFCLEIRASYALPSLDVVEFDLNRNPIPCVSSL